MFSISEQEPQLVVLPRRIRSPLATTNTKCAVVGASSHAHAGATDAGAGYVFANNGGWTEEQELTASDAGAFDAFGLAVSIEDDTALVGLSRRGGNLPYRASGLVRRSELPPLCQRSFLHANASKCSKPHAGNPRGAVRARGCRTSGRPRPRAPRTPATRALAPRLARRRRASGWRPPMQHRRLRTAPLVGVWARPARLRGRCSPARGRA